MHLSDIKIDKADIENCRLILSQLRLDHLPSFASRVRVSGHASTGFTASGITAQQLDCEMLPETDCGSYNVVLYLRFLDGKTWVLKIPQDGDSYSGRWDEAAVQTLRSEAQTMRMIRKMTTIPVPEVYAFDGTMNNELGCPFILMEKVAGKAMHHGWYDTESSRGKVNSFRVKILQDLAEAMVQLRRFKFNQGGSLVYDSHGHLSRIGALDFMDCLVPEEAQETSTVDARSWLDFDPGPFQDAKSYFHSIHEEHKNKSERSLSTKGTHDMLRQFVEWSLEGDDTIKEAAFTLSHPDFDVQNIFTLEDGTLTGIIDWERVASVPKSVGCCKLPAFLTTDYDSAKYDIGVESGSSNERPGDCSSAELASYRAIYADFVERYAGAQEASLTRKSLFMNSLETAAEFPQTAVAIVGRLFSEIEMLTTGASELERLKETNEEISKHSEGGDEDEDDRIDNMTFVELLEEIEELTAPPTPDRDSTTQSSSKGPEISVLQANEDFCPLDQKASQANPKISRRQIIGKSICKWGAKEFKRAAERFHRRKPETKSSEDTIVATRKEAGICESRKARVASALHRWTQNKLNLVIESFHCESKAKPRLGKVHELFAAEKSTLHKFLAWLKKKLDHIMHLLLRQNKYKSESPAEGFTHVKSNIRVDDLKGESTGQVVNTEKKAACSLVASLLKDNIDDLLSEGAQRAFARWMVRNIRDDGAREEHMEDSLRERREGEEDHEELYRQLASKKATIMAEVNGGDESIMAPQDKMNDAEYVETANSVSRKFRRTDRNAETATHFTKSKANHDHQVSQSHSRIDLIDRKRIDLAENMNNEDSVSSGGSSETISNESRNLEDKSDHDTDLTSQLTSQNDNQEVDIENDKIIVVDKGGFTMWEVCTALGKGDLDEARMKRLKEGFLGLLNGTL